MDPITLALMGGTMLSGVMGASATQTANANNAQIAMNNYYLQRAAQMRQAQEAARQQSESKLGETDAAGNRKHFIPGVGWVTTLSGDQATIKGATEDEMIRSAVDDSARNERVGERANDRRNREDVIATEGEREFRAQRRPEEAAIEQMLLAAGAEQRNRSADRAGDRVARQNIRAGGRNAAELVQGARASSDATSARQAGVEAAIMAPQIADQQYDTARSRGANTYGSFRDASTSGTAPGVMSMPNGPNVRGTGSSDQMMFNALGLSPQQPYQNPRNEWGEAIGDIVAAGQGYYGMHKNQQFQDAIIDRMGANTGGFKK